MFVKLSPHIQKVKKLARLALFSLVRVSVVPGTWKADSDHLRYRYKGGSWFWYTMTISHNVLSFIRNRAPLIRQTIHSRAKYISTTVSLIVVSWSRKICLRAMTYNCVLYLQPLSKSEHFWSSGKSPHWSFELHQENPQSFIPPLRKPRYKD